MLVSVIYLICTSRYATNLVQTASRTFIYVMCKVMPHETHCCPHIWPRYVQVSLGRNLPATSFPHTLAMLRGLTILLLYIIETSRVPPASSLVAKATSCWAATPSPPTILPGVAWLPLTFWMTPLILSRYAIRNTGCKPQCATSVGALKSCICATTNATG